MKKIIALITIVFCFSCEEKQKTNPCSEIEKKHDSLLKLKIDNDKTTLHRFFKILNKENGTTKDSVLITEYEDIKGKDSLIDLYIWDRIHTINQNITKLNVYDEFKGTYILKPNHNKKYAQATKVKIENDSCYVFKDNYLIISDKFKLINSSNKYIKGKLRLKNYRLWLDGAIKSKPMIHLDDNGCMDCEQLQFYKIK